MQRVESTDATNLAHLVHGGMIAVMVQKLEGFFFFFWKYSKITGTKEVVFFKRWQRRFGIEWEREREKRLIVVTDGVPYILGRRSGLQVFDKNCRMRMSARPVWYIGRRWLREPYPQISNKSLFVILAENFVKSRVIAVYSLNSRTERKVAVRYKIALILDMTFQDAVFKVLESVLMKFAIVWDTIQYWLVAYTDGSVCSVLA
jgi:hypothetical protein